MFFSVIVLVSFHHLGYFEKKYIQAPTLENRILDPQNYFLDLQGPETPGWEHALPEF